MKEYIEREAARDLMEQALADEWEIQYADDRLDEIPAADVVEVVRCKDCRWHEDEEPGMVYCPATVGGWVENDWFCKGGER